jgi:hypothetical protein
MRMLGHVRRWWFAAAAVLAVALVPLAFGGPVALAQLSNQVVTFSPSSTAPGSTVNFSTPAGTFTPGSSVTCTATGASSTGGTIPPIVGVLVAASNGSVSGTLTVPSSATGSITMSCVGGGGSAAGTLTVSTAPPPIPEADVLVLFGTGLAGLGGYAAVRMRTLRRKLPF